MSQLPHDKGFVDWFRHCAPYIHAHRGRTFVVAFGGEAVEDDDDFHRLVHDLALLNSLGVRLVLVHGTRPQIDTEMQRRGLTPEFHEGVRITRPEALPAAKAAAGTTRVEIESQLSMGQPDSPMSGARVRVACGNFVTSRPVGVRDGVDYWYTGEVRRVDDVAIRQRLDAGAVVLISNLGYSWTGEVFNMVVHDVAAHVATALTADKLVCLTEDAGLLDPEGTLQREPTPDDLQRWLASAAPRQADDTARWARAALAATSRGVPRAHLVPRRIDGGVLRELFTRDGAGTLICNDVYEGMRGARPSDLPGILELIRPLEQAGVLVPRSRERLERELDRFAVVERDGAVVGVGALYPYEGGRLGEISCFAIHEDYRKGGQGDALLSGLLKKAREARMERVFVLTTATAHWFHERGFLPADVDDLPEEKRGLYDPGRASKVLVKELGPAPGQSGTPPAS